MSTTNLAAGLTVLVIACMLMGFVFGWYLQRACGEHPLKDRPVLLTAYQARTIAAFSDGESCVLRWRSESFDIAAGELRPCGLYVESKDRLGSGEPVESEYLAVSIDDHEYLAEMAHDTVISTHMHGRVGPRPSDHFSNYPAGPL